MCCSPPPCARRKSCRESRSCRRAPTGQARGLKAHGGKALEIAALATFREDFAGRILPFDTDAAVVYAEIFADRRSAGRPAATADLMIASIARVRGAIVVTRDTPGFRGCGLTLINPWAHS
jgi:predicted nucleic acid-binding protein